MDAATASSLLDAARQAAEKAYAPYSHFPVGAALLTYSGEILTGVNVENVSYGLTLCAERVAMGRAVAEGHQRFQAIAVWALKKPHGAVTPCGACRQVLAEFFAPDAPVVMNDAQTGEPRLLTMASLLPEAFDGDGSFRDTNSSTPGASGSQR